MKKFSILNSKISTLKGFTLIELLIVITIISTLAVTVFVALNPAQRLKDSKNARRTTDVQSILTAIHAYIVDNKGAYPTGLTAGMAETQISAVAAGSGCNLASPNPCTTGAACVNLATPLANYLKTIPVDPDTALWSTAKSGYSVQVNAAGIVTVKSCGAEGTTIEASR